STLHPTTPQDILDGLAYRFVSCDSGDNAGDSITTTRTSLHLEGGDPQDPAGTTAVVLVLSEVADCRVTNTPVQLGTPTVFHALNDLLIIDATRGQVLFRTPQQVRHFATVQDLVDFAVHELNGQPVTDTTGAVVGVQGHSLMIGTPGYVTPDRQVRLV